MAQHRPSSTMVKNTQKAELLEHRNQLTSTVVVSVLACRFCVVLAAQASERFHVISEVCPFPLHFSTLHDSTDILSSAVCKYIRVVLGGRKRAV